MRPDQKWQTMALQCAAFSLLGVPLEEEALVCLVLCDEVPWHLLFASSGESTANIKGHVRCCRLLYMACFLTLECSTVPKS